MRNNIYKWNKVIVTGGGGFIGSHLTERLVRLGYDVKAFTLYNSFNSKGWLDRCNNEIKKEIDLIKSQVERCKKILLKLSQNPQNVDVDYYSL